MCGKVPNSLVLVPEYIRGLGLGFIVNNDKLPLTYKFKETTSHYLQRTRYCQIYFKQ